jgi:hypothetical protein
MSEDEVFSHLKFENVRRSDNTYFEVPSRADRRQNAASITRDRMHWEERGGQFWPTHDYLSWQGEHVLTTNHALVRRAADIERFFLRMEGYFLYSVRGVSFPFFSVMIFAAVFGKDVCNDPAPYTRARVRLCAPTNDKETRAARKVAIGGDKVIEEQFRSCVKGDIGEGS